MGISFLYPYPTCIRPGSARSGTGLLHLFGSTLIVSDIADFIKDKISVLISCCGSFPSAILINHPAGTLKYILNLSKIPIDNRRNVPYTNINDSDLAVAWRLADYLGQEKKVNITALKRKPEYRALDSKVLVVALAGDALDWVAYIGAVNGISHKEEALCVAKHGTKISEKMATLLFPGWTEYFGSEGMRGYRE